MLQYSYFELNGIKIETAIEGLGSPSMKEFIENNVMKRGQYASEMIISLLPIIMGIPLKIVICNKNNQREELTIQDFNSEITLLGFSNALGNSKMLPVELLFISDHYNILYNKSFINRCPFKYDENALIVTKICVRCSKEIEENICDLQCGHIFHLQCIQGQKQCTECNNLISSDELEMISRLNSTIPKSLQFESIHLSRKDTKLYFKSLFSYDLNIEIKSFLCDSCNPFSYYVKFSITKQDLLRKFHPLSDIEEIKKLYPPV